MKPEQFSPDMLEFLILLARRSVRFLVVGGADAWAGRITDHVAALGGDAVEVHLIGLEELIRNKKAMGRPKDLDDLAFLSAASERTRRG